MPQPVSVHVSQKEFSAHAARLRSLAVHVPAFSNEFKVMLSEMLLLQAFYLFEIAIEEIAAKIVCGAHYVDGTVPATKHTARTIDDAISAMRTFNRTKALNQLKWNQAKVIIANVQHVIAPGEEYCVVCTNYATAINEVRVVRNHIAHGNDDTKKQYGVVVAARLGAAPQRLPKPGGFVLRQQASGSTLLVEYITSLEAIVKAAVKA